VSCARAAVPIDMQLGMLSGVGPGNHVLEEGRHWRNLANTTEQSMCSGDAAFLSEYFDHLLLVHGQVTIIFIVSVGLSVCLFVCLCRVFLSRL